jgi:hypothetical protein
MTAQGLTMTIAWVLLIASWIIPFAFKTKTNSRVIGIIVSAISFGMFLSSWIFTIFK